MARPRRSRKLSLKQNFVPFARCLGYNLGNGVIYQAIIATACRFDLESYQTDFSDVDLERDWSIPQPRANTKGEGNGYPRY